MKKLFALLSCIAILALPLSAQTHTNKSITFTVTAAAPIAATMTFTMSPTAPAAGQLVTYTGKLTGSNNGASPSGTVSVVGATGTQTVSVGTDGSFTCSETITKAGTYTSTATYNGDTNFF